MNPPQRNLPDLEGRLRRARLPLPADETHRYALRRALLQSSYFPDSHLVAWRRRLLDPWRRPARWVATFSSMGAGAAIATALVATPSRQPASVAAPVTAPVAAESTPTLAQTLQDWHDHGQLRYARQEPGGARVYVVHLENGSTLELRDPTPFAISVASSGR